MNPRAFMRQQENLNFGWMTLARWLSTYPPLSQRVQEIFPDPLSTPISYARGKLRAAGILVLFIAVPIAIAASVPLLIQTYGGALSPVAGALNGSDSSDDDTVDAARVPYATVADMPSPIPVPDITEDALVASANACFEGDMDACDALYYNSPAQSAAEDYGNSCGGRIPDNDLECVALVE